jgi:hypothetical protein
VTETNAAGAKTVSIDSIVTDTAGAAGTTTVKAEVPATAAGQDAAVSVTLTSASNTAVVSQSVAESILSAVDAVGADSADIGFSTASKEISVPQALFDDVRTKDMTLSVNSDSANPAAITFPSGSVTTTGEAVSLSVTSGADSFEISITGAESEFAQDVSMSYAVDIPDNATGIMVRCLETGEEFPVDYDGTYATFGLPHFSTWTIVYVLPADADAIDDGDELPPTWHYVPQQQSSSSNTTMIVAACAAAVAAIAVALVMLNVVRKP